MPLALFFGSCMGLASIGLNEGIVKLDAGGFVGCIPCVWNHVMGHVCFLHACIRVCVCVCHCSSRVSTICSLQGPEFYCISEVLIVSDLCQS